ncbi:MAG: OmpA family protein [Mariprofundales bacterium]
MNHTRISPLTLVAAAATLLSACAAAPLDTSISPLDDARNWIAKAKGAGAEKCAPKLQARAVGQLYAAAHEYDEGNVHPDEQAETAADAVKAAKEAYAKAKNCKPEIISLQGVYFDTDSANLKPASVATLNHAVAALKQRNDIRVEVAAHTDSRGGDAHNMGLSNRRAAAVRAYLIHHGIAAKRLSSRGYGENKPIASNATAEGRSKNRRVELRVK